MTPTRLTGVIAAVPTPVTAAGEPDRELFLKHAAFALDNGCDGLNVLGTTGEANSLSAGQRRSVMKAAADALDGTRLMVGTGTPDLATTIELTRYAHECGFAGALVLPPFYYKGVSDEGLFAFFEALAEATADAAIPLYLYNFPQMTSIVFSPALARRLKEELGERVIGAKDSSGDLAYAAELARIDGFDVFPSSETSIPSAAKDNYAGCISATVNAAPSLAGRLWKTPDDAELAKKAGFVRSSIAAFPLIPAVKYMVARIHGDEGFETVLPPHIALNAEQKRALDTIAI